MGPGVKRKLDLDGRVARVVDEALELAYMGGRRVPGDKIAQRIFESEPELMQELHRPWLTDRLTWMINRRRRERWREANPAQLVLPDPVFEDLPTRVFLRNGRRPMLEHCTITQVEDHLRLLRERFKSHPRITQMEAVFNLLRKWANAEHGITWGQAQRREAEERNA